MKCHGAYKTNTSSQKKTPLKMTNRLYAAETKAALVALYITLSCSRPPLTLKSNPGLLTVSWDDVCLSSIQTIRVDISIMFSPRGAAVHPKTRLQSKVRMLLNTAGMCQVNTIYHLSGHCSLTPSVHLLALFCADQKITCCASEPVGMQRSCWPQKTSGIIGRFQVIGHSYDQGVFILPLGS